MRLGKVVARHVGLEVRNDGAASANVEVQIDGKTPVFRVPFIGCRTEGCTAEGVMTPELLTLVRSGEKARVTIMNLQGRAFNFEIPIVGLAGALDSLPRS